MSRPAKHIRNMLFQLLAITHKRDPEMAGRLLARWGFAPGAVTFRRTKTGRTWTEVHQWPWQRSGGPDVCIRDDSTECDCPRCAGADDTFWREQGGEA